MATPSLILVPSKYKVGKLYTPLAINSNGVNIGASGDFNVTRSTSGTRVNAQGFIESVPLLTNFALQSQAFNVTWTQTQVLITGNTTAVTDPEGGTQSDLVVATSLSSEHKVSQTTTSASGSYTLSVYARRVGYNFVYLSIGSVGAYFNLLAGTVGTTSSGIVASIQSAGNSWFRCIISKAAASANEVISINIANADNSITFVGNDIFGVYLYGAQYETGNQAGAYVPTTTTTASNSVPRLDYYTSGGVTGCPALLVEPSGTNGILNSTDTTTSWAIGATLTSGAIDVIGVSGNNVTVAVSGSNIGVLAGNIRRSGNNVALASGSTYTISFFVKKTGTHTIGGYYALITGAAGGDLGGAFNVSGSFSSGSIYNSAGTTNRIRRVEQWGTDVYRCSETFTMTASGTLTTFSLAPVAGVTSSSHPTVGSQLGFAAPQIELGSVPTSFIPTTTGSVTRNADVISVSGAVSGSIGQTVGTIYCEFAYFGRPAIQSGPIFLRQGVLRGLSIGTAGVTNINFVSRNDGGTSAIPIVTGSLQLNTYYKVAIAYDAGGTAAGGSQASGVVAYVNGVQTAIGTFRVPDAAGLTEFRMYGAPAASADDDPFNGRIRAAALYTTRLTNADLMLLTMPGNDTYLPQAVWNNYLSRTGNAEVPDCLYTRHADLLDV